MDTSSDGPVYYVDAVNGNDDNSGLTLETAWRSVAHVNQQSFDSGDTILFKRGATYDDATLAPSSSGASGAPITFGAYGTGAKPLFRGSDEVAGTAGDEPWRCRRGRGMVLERQRLDRLLDVEPGERVQFGAGDVTRAIAFGVGPGLA